MTAAAGRGSVPCLVCTGIAPAHSHRSNCHFNDLLRQRFLRNGADLRETHYRYFISTEGNLAAAYVERSLFVA